MDLVETRSLTKRYGSFGALSDCTLAVRRGEVFGLLGPNGAGKTTLLRLLLGFIRPTAGAARIDGRDCYHDSVEVHRHVAYLPGDVRLFRRMRGHDVLSFFGRVRAGGNLERSLELARRLDLDLSRQVARSSTGMRQKLALAAVLAIDAPLLVLDEPTSNLDPNVRADILALLREACREGRTVLFSSHVLSEVEQVCDRVAILRQGRLVHTQLMSDLRRRHRLRARLTGQAPPPPERIAGELKFLPAGPDELVVETPGELSPLLHWLATLPVSEVHVEPLGLQSIYDRYHAGDRE